MPDFARHEHVNELVPDDVAEFRDRSVCGDDDAPLEEFKKSAHPFRDESFRRVRLLEVNVGAVEDQRDPHVHGVVEFLLQERIALLREVGPPFRKLLHLGIIIDVEMIGLEDAPVEFGVLDFVPSEIEELGVRRGRSQEEKKEQKRKEMGGKPLHCIPVMHANTLTRRGARPGGELPGRPVSEHGNKEDCRKCQDCDNNADLLFSRHARASSCFSLSITATGVGSTPFRTARYRLIQSPR